MDGALLPGTFAAAATRQMRSLGLHGRRILGHVDNGQLLLTGEESGHLAIPLATIERIRIGLDDVKYGPLYESRLWRGGEAQPVTLYVWRGPTDGYAEFVRTAARAVATSRGVAKVERGLSTAGALFAPLLLLPVVAGAIAVSLFALGAEPWCGRLLVPLIPALIFAFLLWRCLARQYPRPVRNLVELERFLP